MNIIVNGIEMADGKRVLLLGPETLDNETAIAIKEVLTNEFPGVTFSVLSGGFQAMVVNHPSYELEIDDDQ